MELLDYLADWAGARAGGLGRAGRVEAVVRRDAALDLGLGGEAVCGRGQSRSSAAWDGSLGRGELSSERPMKLAQVAKSALPGCLGRMEAVERGLGLGEVMSRGTLAFGTKPGSAQCPMMRPKRAMSPHPHPLVHPRPCPRSTRFAPPPTTTAT